mgnify:CR=1 FL=1
MLAKTVLYRKSYTEKTVKIPMQNESDNHILLAYISLLMDYLVGKITLEFLLEQNEALYSRKQQISEEPLKNVLTTVHNLKERLEKGEGKETVEAQITGVIDELTKTYPYHQN